MKVIRRPRGLLPLAIVCFFFASLELVSSWSSLVAYTGDRDVFVQAMVTATVVMPGETKDVGTLEDMKRISKLRGESLWSRRHALLPLAGASAIASLLVLLGIARTMMPSGGRRAWGRSAWQLGCVVALPCMALSAFVVYALGQDIVTGSAAFTDPAAVQLRALAPVVNRMEAVLTIAGALFLLGAARYLASDSVVTYLSDAEV